MTTTELDRSLHTSVLKREEAKEKAYRDERIKAEDEFHSKLGMGGSEMSKAELRKIIDSDRRMYYRTEEINDKLYMHYKGWRELKNLENWTGLKTIYAECNAFSKISGLQNCRQMRSLFLQENCITKISGLETLTELWSLNLSSNFIERIEGLSACKGLNTLIISKNKLGFGGLADLEELADTTVCSLDLQDNKIEDQDVVPEVFSRMKDLRVLYMKGNPAAKKIVNYRKSLTVYCKDLRYLDDRPVFEDDRRQAEAFNRGGIEEQRAETKRIREEKNAKHDRNMRAFQDMIDNSRREKRERDAMRAEDKFTEETDPVESFERRAKRLNDKWKDEHEEELQDDAKVHAQKCLAQEKEGERRAKVATDEKKAATEAREAADAVAETSAGDTADPKQKVDNRKLVYDDIWDDAASGEKKPEKVDNRKLVYDDIWDDTPSAAPAASASAAPSGAPKSFGPPASASEVFMPWADGAMGMDSMPAPSQDLLEKRKAAIRAKAAETADAGAGGDPSSKPSWHSKYLEQVAKTEAALNFNPAPRTAQPAGAVRHIPAAPAAPAAESLPEAASPPEGAGELDEMD